MQCKQGPAYSCNKHSLPKSSTPVGVAMGRGIEKDYSTDDTTLVTAEFNCRGTKSSAKL